jgi:hypothetical protein
MSSRNKNTQFDYTGGNLYLLSINSPANVDYNMGTGVWGSYDGKVLTPGGASSWRKQPNNVPLLKGRFYVPQGTPLPLKNEEVYTELPTDSMFVFSRNISSPACCPSTFSTSNGCVCTTPQQRDLIGVRRGNNKNYPDDSF